MAVDAFIYFIPSAVSGMPKPVGETLDKTFKDKGAFEIKDFSFGIENPHTIGSATSGAGGGKTKFNEFTIKKTTDTASPIFFRNCVTGAHYKQVVIAIRKSGSDPKKSGEPYLMFTFGVVFTTKIDWSGPGDEGPEESITFVFGTLQISYRKQDPSGKLDTTPKLSSWNQMTNTDSVES